MTKDGRHLDQICAGTFGAPTKELVTGTPWQYNLLKFEGNKLTVRTRCRRKENGTWEADSIWRQGKGKGSRISMRSRLVRLDQTPPAPLKSYALIASFLTLGELTTGREG
jgi:hypothetical protein